MKQPKVAIIILNWNGKKDTEECLESVRKITYPNLKVLVVDNASTDGSQQFIKERYPSVHLIENKENLGFTGGNNEGIKYALRDGADYLILLNNDTTVDSLLVQESLQTFLKNKNIGLVGPKVVYYNNPEHIWCAGGSYNPLLGRAVMYGTFSKKKDFEREEEVGWISFCVVMVKREVFEKIGLLDDDFFSSYEDLDFCLRAAKNGYTCAYTPKTVVKHKIAQDWGGLDNPLYIYYQTRNALLCMKKNRSYLGHIIFFLTYFFISVPRRVARLFKVSKTKRLVYMYMGIYDFICGNYRKGVLSERIKKQAHKRKQRLLNSLRNIGINTRYLQRKMSGIERYILELVLGLQEIDETNNYVLFFNNDAKIPTLPFKKRFESYVSSFPTSNRALRLFWEHIVLYYELKMKNIAVFHGPAFFVPLLKPKGCKYVITIHDITFKKYPYGFTRATQLYYKLLFPRSLHLSDVIITDSVSTRNDLLEEYKVDPKKIQVVYLGVSNVFLEKRNKAREENVIKKYALPKHYFLFTGVLSPRKNVEISLLAFEKLKKLDAYKNYKFIIVGRKGWLYETIFEKVEELKLKNDVIFMEYVPEEELPTFYRLAQAYIFPSLYEGFGLPILEAMASGCPVITSNVSSMPEVAGDAAILINPQSVDEIISAIKKICENEKFRKELQRRGYGQVKKFSWQKTAEQTKKIYEEQLKEALL